MVKAHDLLDLDIRMLIPRYFSRTEFPDGTPSKLGIVHHDAGKYLLTLISEGWEILKKEKRKLYGDEYRFPTMRPEDFRALRKNLTKICVEHSEVSSDDFSRNAEAFVRHFAFDRLETQVDSAQEYFTIKQNELRDQPASQTIEKNRHTNVLRNIAAEVAHNPGLLGLDSQHRNSYQEVRFDNLLSRCALVQDHYEGMVRGDTTRNTTLASCDLVVQSSPEDIAIIELKTFENPDERKKKHSRSKQQARNQLYRAGKFILHNFGINPSLIRSCVHTLQNGLRISSTRYALEERSIRPLENFLSYIQTQIEPQYVLR